MSQIGKLFSHEDANLDTEIARLYAFLQEGVGDEDNIDMRAVARRIPGLFGNDTIEPGAVKELLNHFFDSSVTWTVGAETANVIRVTGQVFREDGIDVAFQAMNVWLSDTVTGVPISPTSFTVVDGTQLGQFGSVLSLVMLSDTDGKITLDIEESAAQTRILHIAVHDIHSTRVITWT